MGSLLRLPGVALAAIGAVLAAAPPAPLRAAPLRRLAARTVAFATDGSRYAAWERREGAGLTVLDTADGNEWHVALPGGCALQSMRNEDVDSGLKAAAGRFLLTCGALIDVRTRAVTSLPRDYWTRIGTRYLETNGGDCAQTALERRHSLECRELYAIRTGKLTTHPALQPRDLDARGAPLVCARLRADVIAERELEARTEGVFYEHGALAAAVVPRGREGPAPTMRIESCSGRATVLPVGGSKLNLQLSSRVLTWDDAFNAQYALEELGPAFLYAYVLPTRRLRRLRLPELQTPLPDGEVTGAFGFAAHTADTVFWIAERSVTIGDKLLGPGTYAVYAVPLRSAGTSR